MAHKMDNCIKRSVHQGINIQSNNRELAGDRGTARQHGGIMLKYEYVKSFQAQFLYMD